VSRGRYILYRTVWAVVASLAVTAVLFAIVRVAPPVNQFGEAGLPALEIDNGFWDPADPIHLQYVDWLVSLFTLDWGRSLRFGNPVTELIAERAVITVAYLLPAVLFATVLSTVLGYVAATTEGEWSDGLIRGGSYVVLAVPNFILGIVVFRYVERRSLEFGARFYELDAGLIAGWNLFWLAVAALILATHVAAAQLRYVRAQSSEQLSADYVKILRAKGRGPLGVARHVLRAAAVPLTSLFVAEVLGLLLVSVFVVETVLEIPGLGFVLYQAVGVNDLPVVLVTTWFLSVVVILANLAEDILAVVFDPRVDLQ